MSDGCGRKLMTSTRKKIRKFSSLRGREVQPGDFWDVVVVTAVDGGQKDAYEAQIREKIHRGELPLGTTYRVFSDPPGPKIGNGGSTLHALQQLSSMYGEALRRLKVILIHAGGFSQRLPSASALGKIFMAVPLGDPLYQMLELKLAMYVDFPSNMKPGVLVTCADDIELYSVAEGEELRFDKPGFTALAHPSPLSVGTTHGVFVLDRRDASSPSEMETVSCRRFLHKPSIRKMQDSGAVCERKSAALPVSEAEFVYTDSAYYVDFDTADVLLKLLEELEPLSCEIDAYGDFLQALGPEATVEYTSNTANVTTEEAGLVGVRQKIFSRLQGTPLNAILLNNSKFYHIGTTSELLFHLTKDEELRSQLGLLSSAFSVHLDQSSSGSCGSASSGSCVMHSALHPSCIVGSGSVVEYSRLEAGVSVGRGSIVSSCWAGPGLSVPDGVFVHSLCVNHQNQTGFVTVFFGIDDSLKRSVHAAGGTAELRLCGTRLSECLSLWDVDGELLRFSGDPSSCSLWNARLFPLCSDQQSSFSTSLEMLQALLRRSGSPLPVKTRLLSMQECLQLKSLQEMLTFRKELQDEIVQKKSS
ncbi:fucose-1-phosphate guanylyltransferase [Oryzias melastigma]|uniref:Fucose-1-phosphate guanylyltransferase n=1 Tax=Oryzias melastigma TaxID=30732 RepID=A0A3B3BGU6_ORYME|nr:fucose-1-phosphate guanylyltransferase [Oryzias melastigma]